MRSFANLFKPGPRRPTERGTARVEPARAEIPPSAPHESSRPPDPRLAAAAELRSTQGARPLSGARPDRGAPPDAAPTTPNWATEELETPEQLARRRIRQRIDDAISEAQERGEFANLRGTGKPIPPELLVSADDAWLAGKTMANAGFLPPWLQLQHEIENDLVEARRLVERTERFPPLTNRELPLTELRERLHAIQAKARRYNLMAPTMSLQRPLPKTAELERRMVQAVARPVQEQA